MWWECLGSGENMGRNINIGLAGLSTSLMVYFILDLTIHLNSSGWLFYDLLFIGLNAMSVIKSIIDAVEAD